MWKLTVVIRRLHSKPPSRGSMSAMGILRQSWQFPPFVSGKVFRQNRFSPADELLNRAQGVHWVRGSRTHRG
jgi:hypothetical protein